MMDASAIGGSSILLASDWLSLTQSEGSALFNSTTIRRILLSPIGHLLVTDSSDEGTDGGTRLNHLPVFPHITTVPTLLFRTLANHTLS